MVEVTPEGSVVVDGKEIGTVATTPQRGRAAPVWVALIVTGRGGGPGGWDFQKFTEVGHARTRQGAVNLLLSGRRVDTPSG
ncbi:MAG: hypothetical protein ACRDOE_00130 [Streptosporangiaceae bacterium]